MGPYEAAMQGTQQALTIEMLLSEPPAQLTEVEKMIIEQRGLREIPFPGMV